MPTEYPEDFRRQHHVNKLVRDINFPGYKFYLSDHADFMTVRVGYEEKDVMTGVEEKQLGRRWIIEPDAADMAIIQTCFKALLTSLEHRAREHFTYKDRAILQPHFKLEELLSIAPCRVAEGEPLLAE